MLTWKQIEKLYKGIRDQIGGVGVTLIRPCQHLKLTDSPYAKFGKFPPGICGAASPEHNTITVPEDSSQYDVERFLWHELAHVLFPSAPHWWIEGFSARMSPFSEGKWAEWSAKNRGAAGIASRNTGHSIDELPSREELIKLASEAARRLDQGTVDDEFRDDLATTYYPFVSKPRSGKSTGKRKSTGRASKRVDPSIMMGMQ